MSGSPWWRNAVKGIWLISRLIHHASLLRTTVGCRGKRQPAAHIFDVDLDNGAVGVCNHAFSENREGIQGEDCWFQWTPPVFQGWFPQWPFWEGIKDWLDDNHPGCGGFPTFGMQMTVACFYAPGKWCSLIAEILWKDFKNFVACVIWTGVFLPFTELWRKPLCRTWPEGCLWGGPWRLLRGQRWDGALGRVNYEMRSLGIVPDLHRRILPLFSSRWCDEYYRNSRRRFASSYCLVIL